jgi:hypothetical protein
MSEIVKKVLSPEKLKQLEIARIKANQVRKANAELKQKEQALKVIEHQKRVNDVETKLKSLKIPAKIDEPEEPPTRGKKKKIVYVEESSDSEPEVVYVKKPKKIKPKAEPEPEEQMLEPEYQMNQVMSQAQIKNEMARMRREMARKMMFRAY